MQTLSEMLAVVVACEKFHSYLFGKKFTIKWDHKPLKMIHLKNLKEAGWPRGLGRWISMGWPGFKSRSDH